MPIYRGAYNQRGHGLGSIFGGLMRGAIPIFKHFAKKAGKALARKGIQYAQDKLENYNGKATGLRGLGVKVGKAVLNTGRNVLDQSGRGRKRKPKKAIKRKCKKRKISRKKTTKLEGSIFN